MGKVEFHFNLELHRQGQYKVCFCAIKQFASLLENISNFQGEKCWTPLNKLDREILGCSFNGFHWVFCAQ